MSRNKVKQFSNKNKTNLNYHLLLLITHHSTQPPEANTAMCALPPFRSIQSLPLYTLPGSSHFLQTFLNDTLPPLPRKTCFPCRPTLDGSPKRTIFGNLLSFIQRIYPSYLNLYLIIAFKSGN